MVVPKAEKLLKVSIQPYISSILDALMEPTSRGFSEVRDLFFRELVDMSKNTINEGTKEMVAQVGGDLHGSPVCCDGGKKGSCWSVPSTWRRSPCWPSIL